MNQGPFQNRAYRVNLNTPKGWLSLVLFVIIAVVAVVLALSALIILIPAGLITGWYLKKKAAKAQPVQPSEPTQVIEASDYKVQ